jgi:hypothetical protein
MESKLEEKSQTSRTTYVYGLDRQYAWLPVERFARSSEKCFTISTFPYIFAGLFFKYCLLAIRLEDTSVYNLICCLVVVSWKGDHPAMSPQSCRSEVQRLFSLLLRVGCVSVSTSGLGWDSSLLRCLVILSLMTSLT